MRLFLTYLTRRAISYFLTFLLITAVLYAGIMQTPPEDRAELYMPYNTGRMSEEQIAEYKERVIVKYHLNESFAVQYGYWLQSLFTSGWGYSQSLKSEVLPAILRLTPATAELTLFATLLFLPFGLLSGIRSGSRHGSLADNAFRLQAFLATSIPPFLLAILMMILFYIELYWFQPGRLNASIVASIARGPFQPYTGFMTIDGLLNKRPDISLDALRHLVMPAVTLALPLWATVGRVTRASMASELKQDYITAARGRGVTEHRIRWSHALRNVISPVFSNVMLSIASLMTSTFIVEIIFDYPGISYVIRRSIASVPDAPAALGFAVYSVIIVLLLMATLDVFSALLDPRVYQGGRHA